MPSDSCLTKAAASWSLVSKPKQATRESEVVGVGVDIICAMSSLLGTIWKWRRAALGIVRNSIVLFSNFRWFLEIPHITSRLSWENMSPDAANVFNYFPKADGRKPLTIWHNRAILANYTFSLYYNYNFSIKCEMSQSVQCFKKTLCGGAFVIGRWSPCSQIKPTTFYAGPPDASLEGEIKVAEDKVFLVQTPSWTFIPLRHCWALCQRHEKPFVRRIKWGKAGGNSPDLKPPFKAEQGH